METFLRRCLTALFNATLTPLLALYWISRGYAGLGWR